MNNNFRPGNDISTRPTPAYRPIERLQAVRIPVQRKKRTMGCGVIILALLMVPLCGLVISMFIPLPINFVVMGIDRTPDGSALGRSDTIVLITAQPSAPYVGFLSIPRDLWVNIPGVGENRINAAHFFAEANQPGSGPQALLDTIQADFQVAVPYFVRFQFQGFEEIVRAIGGVTIELTEPQAGYEAGTHHLPPEQALAFVRDRKGSDDFFRMQRGQIFIRAVISQLLRPTSWLRLPAILTAILANVDTDLPAWQWLRVAVAVLRVGTDGIDTLTITREMVDPFTTEGGASVLGPRWEVILPFVHDFFLKK